MTIFAPVRVRAERRADGAILLRSTDALASYAPSMAHLFRQGAERHPGRTLAAQREGS